MHAPPGLRCACLAGSTQRQHSTRAPPGAAPGKPDSAVRYSRARSGARAHLAEVRARQAGVAVLHRTAPPRLLAMVRARAGDMAVAERVCAAIHLSRAQAAVRAQPAQARLPGRAARLAACEEAPGRPTKHLCCKTAANAWQPCSPARRPAGSARARPPCAGRGHCRARAGHRVSVPYPLHSCIARFRDGSGASP